MSLLVLFAFFTFNYCTHTFPVLPLGMLVSCFWICTLGFGAVCCYLRGTLGSEVWIPCDLQQTNRHWLAIVLPSPPQTVLSAVYFNYTFSRFLCLAHHYAHCSSWLVIYSNFVPPSARRLWVHHVVVLCRRRLSHCLETKIVPMVPIGRHGFILRPYCYSQR